MIGYCPLDEEPPVRRVRRTGPVKSRPVQTPGPEASECNYVVMFFIVGVLILAVTDSMQK